MGNKNLPLIFVILILCSSYHVYAEDFGYNYLESGKNLNPSLNQTTLNVNSSYYWNTSDRGPLRAVADILHNWLDSTSLLWSNAGHTIDEDFDMNGYDILMEGGNIDNVSHVQFNILGNGCVEEFCMEVDADMGKLTYTLPGGNVKNSLGFETYFGDGRVKNIDSNGYDIINCRAVWLSGSQGQIPVVELAGVDKGFRIAQAIVGLATEDISYGQQGYVTSYGIVRDCDTSGYSVNDSLFLYTNGTFTNDISLVNSNPNGTIFIGTVNRVHATEGEINVQIDKQPWLTDLSDVASGQVNLNVLMWNSTAGMWQPKSLDNTYYNATSGVNITGTTEGNITLTQHSDGNYDGITFNITERVTAPALDLRVNFTDGIERFDAGVMRYYTSTLSGDYPIIQLWDYEDLEWEDYPTLEETTSFKIIQQSVFDWQSHVQDGTVQMRLYKSSNGNVNNKYYIDWLAISKGFGTPSGEEVDPLAFHKSGDVVMEGDADWGGYDIDNVNDLDVNNVATINNLTTETYLNSTLSKAWFGDTGVGIGEDAGYIFIGDGQPSTLHGLRMMPYTTSATQGSGISMFSGFEPSDYTTGSYAGVGGYTVFVGENWGIGSILNGLGFGNYNYFLKGAGFIDANAGSYNLSIRGIDVFGVNAVTASKTFAKEVFGIRVQGTLTGTTNQSRGIYILNDGANAAVNYSYLLDIEKPTRGAIENRQLNLQGNGDGTGAWFDDEFWLQADGTNFNFNQTGDGVWTFWNSSGLGKIRYGEALTSTQISTDENVLESFVLGENLLDENRKPIHENFGNCYEIINETDYSRPVIVPVEECKMILINGSEEIDVTSFIEQGIITQEQIIEYGIERVCEMIDTIEYPHKKEVATVDLTCQQAELYQWGALENRNKDLYPNLTDFNTGVISEGFFTQSKTVQDNVSYIDKIKDKEKLKVKETHYSYVDNVLGSGLDGLDLEERVVVLEGAVNELFTILCDKNILKKEDGCL